MRTLTLADLRGENALTIIGTVARLLCKLDREVGTSHAADYSAKAMASDYDHLCAVTEEYVLRFLATTLSARPGDLTGDDEDDGPLMGIDICTACEELHQDCNCGYCDGCDHLEEDCVC